jgi:hypothetical protein
MTYVVDVNPDGNALDAVDSDVVLEVLAQHLAGQHVVQHILQKEGEILYCYDKMLTVIRISINTYAQ